jgi:hypothetical protein
LAPGGHFVSAQTSFRLTVFSHFILTLFISMSMA